MKIRTIKIILLFLLFIDLWAYKSLIEDIQETTYKTYKTLVIFKGQLNKRVESKWKTNYPVEDLLYDFFDPSDILVGSIYIEDRFIMSVKSFHEKTIAIRYLKEGILDGEVYVDEHNYLVTE